MAAAPAPEKTMRTSSIRLFTTTRALSRAAPEMMAVPCWSSWKTGMLISAFRRRSISKHSGARMSSRLMPPKVGSRSLAPPGVVGERILAADLFHGSPRPDRQCGPDLTMGAGRSGRGLQVLRLRDGGHDHLLEHPPVEQ